MTSPHSNSPFTQRAALLLVLAVVVGFIAGCLSYVDASSLPGAFLVGGAAAGGALLLFNTLVES